MKQKPFLSVAVLGLFAAVGCQNMNHESEHQDKDKQEVKVPVESLPAAVTNAVIAAMPDGKVTDAEKETKIGETAYELDVQSQGKTFEVMVSPEGKVLSSKAEKEKEKD